MRRKQGPPLLRLLLLGAAAVWLAAMAQGPPKPPGHISRVDVWRAELPGQVVSQAAHRLADGVYEVFLAVRPLAEGEVADSDVERAQRRRLYRFRLAEQASLTELPSLPPREHDEPRQEPQLKVATWGDRLQLFVAWGARGYLHPVVPQTRPRSQGGFMEPVVIARDDGPWSRLQMLDFEVPLLISTGIGRLEVFRFEQGRVESKSFRLPLEVERRSHGLELDSPPVRLLRSAPPLYAVGPQSYGDLRLRTLVIDPQADPMVAEPRQSAEAVSPEAEESDDERDSGERWSRLPGPERVEESRYLWIAGRPILAAVTLRADKMGIFERKKLRLFELDADRTRTGSAPLFATFTASRLWQQLGLEIVDADGDGVSDLVLIQPEGLAGNKLAVDLYRGIGDLRFESKPERALIRLEGGSWHFGDDWTGDGLPDLLSLRHEVLRLFPQQAGGKSWLSEQPLWEHRVEGPLRPVVADDGSVEEVAPTRRATFEAGLVIVRSRYPQGNDLIEIVAPASSP